jgi:hypothetical protein
MKTFPLRPYNVKSLEKGAAKSMDFRLRAKKELRLPRPSLGIHQVQVFQSPLPGNAPSSQPELAPAVPHLWAGSPLQSDKEAAIQPVAILCRTGYNGAESNYLLYVSLYGNMRRASTLDKINGRIPENPPINNRFFTEPIMAQ